MRRDRQRMDRADALAFLAQAPFVHVATTRGADDEPILRTVNGVVVGDAIYFHGAQSGEKVLAIGRRAVVGTEELVALVPSYFTDPDTACPATAFYRSVQVHGRLEQVDDLGAKARVLQALMEHNQPEGGHRPIEADDLLYAKQLKAILVLKVSLDCVEGKSNLAQLKKPEQREAMLAGLWKRGAPGDLRAIELVCAANPGTRLPRLEAPEGIRFCVAPCRAELDGAVALVSEGYWNADVTEGEIRRAHQRAGAWITAHDTRGVMVATARAATDGKVARIKDVAVAGDWRRRGLGSALMRVLLDHPALRECRAVTLGTRDSQAFYRTFGFAEATTSKRSSERDTEMILATPNAS